ncbi:MAG: CARDB domain-containing protein, partial [Candidatus Aenigmatarchaeota archaeon]
DCLIGCEITSTSTTTTTISTTTTTITTSTTTTTIISPLPDLRALDIFTESQPKVNEVIKFIIKYDNIGGSTPTTDIYAQVYVDGSASDGCYYFGVPPAPGETRHWSCFGYKNFSSPGNHTMSMKVDSTDLVAESDETNNEITKMFIVIEG